jgi:lysophospholipase L1-like esterase
MRCLGVPVVRLLLAAVSLLLLAGCAPQADQDPVSLNTQRWVLLGDRTAVPDTAAIAAAAHLDGRGRPAVIDLTSEGAGIQSVIEQQMLKLPQEPVDLIVLALGPADASMSPEHYGGLVGALLHTLRERAPVLVQTIAAPSAMSREPRLATARRLRPILEYNDAIRAVAPLYGAALMDAEEPSENADDLATGTTPWLSGFDGPAQGALRDRAADALKAGRRLDVVAKLGDSITVSPAFLKEVTATDVQQSAHGPLVAAFAYFNHTLIPSGTLGATPVSAKLLSANNAALSTSFRRESLGAGNRWFVTDLLVGGEASALARELTVTQAGVAVVMFGTNDLTLVSVEEFEESLSRLLTEMEQRRVIPLLSTIPNRGDRPDFSRLVPSFNAAIRALARVYDVPLIDYGAVMAGLPNAGLNEDGIHPSICPEGPGSLSDACLRYGYNLRNLLTLQALEQLRLNVFDEFLVPSSWFLAPLNPNRELGARN